MPERAGEMALAEIRAEAQGFVGLRFRATGDFRGRLEVEMAIAKRRGKACMGEREVGIEASASP